ncbi:MAG: hypothetical protein J0H20_14705, partial [Rhizobiales bacterium]|nr:hypothetical protein [Hyphomicrobiales bacterium]
PLMAIMVSHLMPGNPLQRILGHGSGWLEFALATPVVLWAGWPFFERAWASIIHRNGRSDFRGNVDELCCCGAEGRVRGMGKDGIGAQKTADGPWPALCGAAGLGTVRRPTGPAGMAVCPCRAKSSANGPAWV